MERSGGADLGARGPAERPAVRAARGRSRGGRAVRGARSVGVSLPGFHRSARGSDGRACRGSDPGGVSTTPTDTGLKAASWVGSPRAFIAPLALAQFICSFAGSNMNVMINDISHDLNTTVQGVQVCITLFLLVMAALMIPCGKLTDKLGRKWCFQLGLLIYGVGAIVSAASPGLGVLILGNSI